MFVVLFDKLIVCLWWILCDCGWFGGNKSSACIILVEKWLLNDVEGVNECEYSVTFETC